MSDSRHHFFPTKKYVYGIPLQRGMLLYGRFSEGGGLAFASGARGFGIPLGDSWRLDRRAAAPALAYIDVSGYRYIECFETSTFAPLRGSL